MMRRGIPLLLALFTTPFACSNQGQVDIGDPIGSNLVDYAGNWDGYAEAYMFHYGNSDRVRLSINPDGVGTMEVGDAALLPAPTNPDVGYPPVPSVDPMFGIIGTLRDGVEYPVHDAAVESSRIRFKVNTFDMYGPWCEIQTPTLLASGSYSCADSSNVTGLASSPDGNCQKVAPDGSMQTVDCGKYILCAGSSVCDCTPSGCTAQEAPNPAVPPVLFDAALEQEGSRLVGTLQVDSATRVIVRMQRN
jgi:hypothetical protein